MNQKLPFWLRSGFLYAYLALFCVGVVMAALIRPLHTWDTISYSSLAKEKDFDSIEALHRDAFEGFIASVGKPAFDKMLWQHHPEFRQAMYEDVEVFEQQLNFFRPRVGFTQAVRLLHQATGLDTRIGGTVVASAAAALGFLLLALLFFERVDRPMVLLFPVAGLLFGVLDLARRSSPDALAFLFVALSCYAMFRGRWLLLFLALPAAVASRPDTVIWAGLFCAYLAVARGGAWRWGAVLSAVASVAVYKWANQLAGQYPWGVLIENAFWDPLLKPAEAEGIVTVARYAKILAVGVMSAAVEPVFLAFLFLLLWFVGETVARRGATGVANAFRDPWLGVAAVALLYIGAHFVLFPVLWHRFFVVQFLFIAFLFMASIRPASIRIQPVSGRRPGDDGEQSWIRNNDC